ncbi:penicillin-binding protein [Bacillus coahuilensis p1.1.43]|uniref:serine-type D-Ala-D-Ala carboxypeptidase n=1 Tax=Bacillus coahuilensis p1.1.43 TaxID=1150625 RepID=A0A147K9E2_9BACI|nr:penicillin-binding transpeptidase domain-containing protein [Bacillus coahuilensis]KUP07014.1 penicillin-binding protein [Bacillus coahuilensis p1.1.43]
MWKQDGMKVGAVILLGIFILLFFLLFSRFISIQVSGEVNEKDLNQYAEEIYHKEGVIEAKRGTIYDRNGDVIAEDSVAYTLVAILDDSVTTDEDNPKHVVDYETTAAVLSQYIDLDEQTILEKLKKKESNPKLFQVEFGSKGRDLSHTIMEQIREEELPGIIFNPSPIRFYPNGMFASHLIGYAQKEDNQTVGKMGIELSWNEQLTGSPGAYNYNSDIWGYILPYSEKIITSPQDGQDIYLTIDKTIQTFLEEALTEAEEKYSPEKMLAVVADPKTGEILAMGQRPSFNPSDRVGLEKNWHNEVVEFSYEPGSTMKTFTLAAAIEEGVFNPNDYYQSGQYKAAGGTISDHNQGRGWGPITFLEGFQRSSNVAMAYLLEKIGQDRYLDYLNDFHFGQKTGIELPGETSGKILYNYPLEKVTTAFGQGTTVTPLQLIQAETAIAGNGEMLKPYIIDKVVDPTSNKTIYKNEPITVGTPIQKDTAEKVRGYLESTVSAENGTGKPFKLSGYTVAGKTGTAQIPNPDGSGYMTGLENYLFSFLGMAPADNPQLIVYVAVQQPQLDVYESGSAPVSLVFNTVMENSLKYLAIQPTNNAEPKATKVPNFEKQSVESFQTGLQKKGIDVVIIGNGDKVIGSVPNPGATVLEGEKVIVVTDGEKTVPHMIGWSQRDVLKVIEATNSDYHMLGSGFVIKQSVTPGQIVREGEPLVVTFETYEESSTQENEEITEEDLPQD